MLHMIDLQGKTPYDLSSALGPCQQLEPEAFCQTYIYFEFDITLPLWPLALGTHLEQIGDCNLPADRQAN